MPKPVIFTWDGQVMRPHDRFSRVCGRQFTPGEHYTLIVHEERSQASHNQFFAAVAEAWKNLPEGQAHRFPTPEHLRKYALIRCGYANKRHIVCTSDEEALRIAAFMQPLDAYAVFAASGPVLTVYTAQSQAKDAMNKAQFQKSKQDVLDFLGDFIGIAGEQLSQEGNRQAPHHRDERLRSPVKENA